MLVGAVGGWVEYPTNPVFDPVQKAYYPSVLKIGPNQYMMWYSTTDAYGNIRYATSTDGISWTDGGPVSGLLGQGQIPDYTPGHPTVIWDHFTNEFKMYYWFSYNHLNLATSTDGIHWTDRGHVLNSPSDIYDAFVMIDGTTYKAWINAGGRIYYSTSPDGINWSPNSFPDGNTPVFSADPSTWEGVYVTKVCVLKVGGLYVMWYGAGAPTDANKGIGAAYSTDGISWTRYPDNPIFHVNDGKAWRDDRTYTPWVIYDEGMYKMWFTGKSKTPSNYAIGYAYIPRPVGGIWVPINKFELLAPWIGLASLITVATASVIYVKHRKES